MTVANLAALAGRDDCGAFSMLQQSSSGAIFGTTVNGGLVTGVFAHWNVTAISNPGTGIFTVTCLPFDFVDTSFPIWPFAMVLGVHASNAPTALYCQAKVISQIRVDVYVTSDAGAAADLGADDRLMFLAFGRRARPTSDGTNVISPFEALKPSHFNLGVTGL
jgi:hypothetical protein